MNENLLSKLKAVYSERIRLADDKLRALKQKAIAIPRYKELNALKIDLLFNQAKGMGDYSAEIGNIDNQLSDLLERHGIDLKPKYVCAECKDTGFIGEEECSCRKREYLRLLSAMGNLNGLPQFTFDDNKISDLNCTQSQNMTYIYDKLDKLSRNWKNGKYRILLVAGKVGVGKTCLVSAMAHRMAECGDVVQFVRAFEMSTLLLKHHLSPVSDSSYLDALLECDVLIIDDLGTEPMYKNVSLEYLYSILTVRAAGDLMTVITTNLPLDELYKRYDERIYSRLCDKSRSMPLNITGDDLRRL